MITVAVCQITPLVENASYSRQQILLAVEEAAQRGAHIVVLPELASSGYSFKNKHELKCRAETLYGDTAILLKKLATAYRLVIISGLAEIDGSKFYNTAILVDETGLRASYRKAHLWDTEKISGFTPGDSPPPVVNTQYGRISIMVCYDLEFPEWVRLAALNNAEILCAPVNWPLIPRPSGERPNEIIRAQANAAVNRMFIAIADRTGTERHQAWLGGSVIINADGYPVSELQLGRKGVITASINLAEASNKSISMRNDVHADRRPSLYRGTQS